MERLVGLALSRYLAVYIKDFNSSQFQNWSLRNLEFKEDVIQSLAGIPANFELKKVTCNEIYVKIPSLSKLGSDPIVLVADTIYIELEEPEVIKPTVVSTAVVPPPQPKHSQGLMDRIMDNIKFELKELRIKLKLLGKEKRSSTFDLTVQDIAIKSTNAEWKVVDLRQVHTVDKNGHVIMFKEIDIGRFTFSVSENDKPVSVLNQLPIRVRTKTKKAYFRGPTINHAIFLDVLDQLALRLHSKQFKILQDAVDALLECMGRSAPAPTIQASGDANSPATSAQITQHTSQPPIEPPKAAPSIWGRFASVIGSYAGYGSSTTTPIEAEHQSAPQLPAVDTKSTPPEGNADIDAQPSRDKSSAVGSNDDDNGDSDSDEEYRDAESEVPSEALQDKTSAPVQNDQDDITHTSYTIGLKSGSLSVFDFVLEEQGIAELKFENLRCQFVPNIKAVRPKICFDQDALTSSSDVPLTLAALHALEAEVVEQMKISVTIESYSLNQLDPGPNRHPDYAYLLKRVTDTQSGSSSLASSSALATDLPTLTLDFVKFPDWKTPSNLRREAQLTIDSVAVVADLRPWERLWNFFFGGQKGEKFAQYMQDNLGQMLEAALTNQVHFKFDCRRPTILLPPYASKFIGKPHLASKVLRIHANNLTMRSLPVESPIEPEFSQGLFVMEEYPVFKTVDFSSIDVLGDSDTMSLASEPSSSDEKDALTKKYRYPKRYDARDPLVMTERKFECSMNGMWIDIQADPESKAERVLKPFNMNAQCVRREFQVRSSADEPLQLPRFTPQLDGFVSLSEIGVAFTPSQYTFLLGIWTERLAWNPNRVTDEMAEAMKMEMLLEAAEQGASSSNTLNISLPEAEDPPLLMRVRVFVPGVNLQLLERPAYLHDTPAPSGRVSTSTSLDTSKNDIRMPDGDAEIPHSDSPSSTIQHEPESDTPTTTHVILAEMAFSELSYVFESHAERTIQKVSSPQFEVSSPVHIDSPFSKLVAPLASPISSSNEIPPTKPALLVRMEKFKDEAAAAKVLAEEALSQPDPLLDVLDAPISDTDLYLRPTSAASPVMNVRLHGMQVCWIYTTLAEVQVWFTRGDEIPPEFRNLTIPYISTAVELPAPTNPAALPSTTQHPAQPSSTSDEAPSLGMNWAVVMVDTELVVIETPDTPECMPMGLLDARVERRGVSPTENQFDFFGKCVISSEMWDAESGSFTRVQLTSPFNMDVAYIQERNETTNSGSTNMEMLIDDLQLTINRKQLIMVQNILDNQMADIRDVSTKREAEKASDAETVLPGPSSASSSNSVPTSSQALPNSSSTPSIPKAAKTSFPEKLKLTLPRNDRGMTTSASGTNLRASTSSIVASSSSHDLEFNPRAPSSLHSSHTDLSNSSSSIKPPRAGSVTINADLYKEVPSADSTLPKDSQISDSLLKVLRSRFQIGIQKLNLKLLDPSAQPIAAIRLDDFLYSTENWSDVNVMLIEGGLLTISSTREADGKSEFVSPYATILQPRLADSIGGKDAVMVAHAPTLVPVVESFMPIISEESGPGLPAALQAKLARELKQAQLHQKAVPAGPSTDLDAPRPPPTETMGIPIDASFNYGAISASPMINSFVMLSAPNSEKFDPSGAAAASAPNSSKQPISFKFPRRKNRRSTQESAGNEMDVLPLLSASSSMSNLKDLPTIETHLSQTYSGNSGLLPASSGRMRLDFTTPQKAPGRRSATPFPASGRDPTSAAFSRSLATGATDLPSRNLRDSSDDSSLRTPSKLSGPPSNKRHSVSRSAIKRNSLWTDTDEESEDAEDSPEADDPVQLSDGRMFSLKFENIQRDFKGVREDRHAKWLSRWSVGLAPFDLVYDATAFAQLQDFFALMAEHKNLRHRYQSFQTEVLKVYKEQGGIINQAVLEELQTSQVASEPLSINLSTNADEHANRVALNILISGPRVSIPQPLEEESKAQKKTLLSVLEFSLGSIRVVNAANSRAKNDHRSQTKILVTDGRCFMKTIELSADQELPADAPAPLVSDPFSMDPPSHPDLTSSSTSLPTSPGPKTLGAIALQTQELARPINAKIDIEMKPVSASGRPFMHVSVDIDMLAAMISIKRYQLLVELVNNYVLSFFKRSRANDNDAGVAPEYSAFMGAMAGPEEQEEVHVDKLVEVNVKTVNLTVISDYMAELELVYLHVTDFNASMGLYSELTDISLAGRLEVLINNLNYMIPERFVDELNFVVRLRSEKRAKKESAPAKSKFPRLVHSRQHSMNEAAINDLKMSNGLQRRSRSLQETMPSDIESGPDMSMWVEPDDELESLDAPFPDEDVSVVGSEADFGATRSAEGLAETTTTTLDIAVLDGIKFTLTQDLMRHLVELYQLYSQVQKGTTATEDQSLLHFQYVLVNRTDLPIRYWQTNTDDDRMLNPGDETYFTFSNPYQLKRLEIEMLGWTHDEQAFSPEEVGSMVFHLSKSIGNVESNRDLLVSIQPKGLKRYVEFLTTHHVVNDTDKVLIVRLIHSASKGDASANQYMIAPHTTVPISCSESWPVDFAVTFADGSWDFSRPLPISKDRPHSITDTIKLFAQHAADERWLLCTTTREPFSAAVHEGVQMVTLHFGAPVVIENLCVFPLEYYFPSMLPRRPRPNLNSSAGMRNVYQAVYEEEDKLADSIAAVLPANSVTYFYFDTFRHRELCCRLAGYSMWSGRIQIERVQYSSLELYKAADECMEGEKDDIMISVFIYGRHHDFARRLAFNTQFLFVNDTDMLLFVRQHNTIPMTQIAPRQMTPFSWVRGSSKTLSVNMGNTAWSPPIDISTDSYQRIEIKVPNFDVSYMFLMESHGLDAYSRVVAWRSWFHIRNHSSYDLKFYLKGAKKSSSTEDLPSFELDDDENDVVVNRKPSKPKKADQRDYALLLDDDGDEESTIGSHPPLGSIQNDMESPTVRNTVFGDVHVSDQGWVMIPRHSNTTSGLCPDILGLTIAKDYLIPETAHVAIKTDEEPKQELWSAVEIPTTFQSTYSVPITSLSDPKIFRALDVAVTTDEKGLYITLTDNKDPPFIIHNETPYALKLRRQPKSQSSSSSGPDSGHIHRTSGTPKVTSWLSNGETQEYLVEPHSKLNLFSSGLGDEDDFEYRASVVSPEEYRVQQQGAKHGRKVSGGNAAGLGLSPATILHPGHRRAPSGSAFSTYHGDAPDIISPTSSTAHRAKRHSLLGGTSPIGSTSNIAAISPSPLPVITDTEDEDLMSAMDGEMSEDEETTDFPIDQAEDGNPALQTVNGSKRTRRRKNLPPLLPKSPRAQPSVASHSRNPSLTSTQLPAASSGTPPLGSRSSSDSGPGRKTLAIPPLPTSSPEHRKQGHSRKPSGSGNILSPRGTLAMDAMDAFSSAIGQLGDGSDSSSSQIHITSTARGDLPSGGRVDGRVIRQFRSYFSESMDAWSQPFNLKSALEYSVDWQDERSRVSHAWQGFDRTTTDSMDEDVLSNRGSQMFPNGNDRSAIMSDGEDAMPPPYEGDVDEGSPNMLLVTSQPQGKTRVVKFGLPPVRGPDGTLSADDDDQLNGNKNEAIRRVMKVDFLVPEILVLMLTSETRDPAASIRFTKVQMELNQYSNLQHSLFFVMQGAESNTLSTLAEYPVLFGVDRRALHGAHPRFLEFLVEWNVREDRTFIDYIGLRVLPFVLQIDSEIIDSLQDVRELLGPLFGGGAVTDESADDKELQEASSASQVLQSHTRRKNGYRQQAEAAPSNAAYASSSAMVLPSSANGSASFSKGLLSALSSMDPASLEEYGAGGRLGLGDSGSFGGGYFYSGAADRELTDNNPAAPRNRLKLRKLLKLYTEIQHYQFVQQESIAQDNFLYVGRLEVFPLRVSISIGTNNKHWPVIAEAHMQLPSFGRNDLSESIGTLFSTLGSAYSNLVWAEIYQIIGNLDAIASPLQNLRKLAKGVQDFFKLPLEGLVLDDTPGAYLVGLWYGLASLVLNWTDFLLTVMMKSFQTLSWATQVLSLDEEHQKVKGRVARQHPTNVIYGMGQGVRECARGIFEGLSGFVTLPMRGVKQSGASGFFIGAGKALIGLPLKPIGGVFDLFSKTFEGLLQTMGRGYLLQERAETSFSRQQLPEAEVREQIQRFITMRDQRILILDDARFMRHGRPLERYLVLTFHALYIININKLHFDDYSPKKIPLGLIKNLVVPVTPETQMVVKLHQGQQLWKQDQFLFIVPDRKHFILKMAARFGIKTLEVAKLEKLL
jgi:hypothetical protein